MSPCSSRTARPSFRSMAGKRIMRSPCSLDALKQSAASSPPPAKRWGGVGGGGSSFAEERAPHPDAFGVDPPHRSQTLAGGGNSARISKKFITASTCKKFAISSQPQPLALLRVKLRADHVVAPDDGRERTAVVGLRHQVGALRRLQLVGVHEIGVQPVGPERRCRRAADAACSMLSVFQPMCGIFKSGSVGVMRSTSPAIQPRPGVT